MEKIGRVTSASVEKCTGKNCDQWIAILEKRGARSLSHKEIVAILKTKYRLSLWWQQGVATGFEIYIGRKKDGQNANGEVSLTATKTLSVGAPLVWKYLTSKEGLTQWLTPMSDFTLAVGSEYEVEGGVFGEVRTVKRGSRLRMTWRDTDWAKPSTVQIFLVPRTKVKCLIAVTQEKIPSARAQVQLRAHWQRVLVEMAQALASKS